jgi:hypothetical protein
MRSSARQPHRLLIAAGLIALSGACSRDPANLMDSGTLTGGSMTGGSSGGSTTASFIPEAVFVSAKQHEHAYAYTDGTSSQAFVGSESVTLTLAGGNGHAPLAACPTGTVSQSGCCIGPVSAFLAADDGGCSGSVQAALYPDASIRTDDASGCAVTEATTSPFDRPFALGGMTGDGMVWAASLTFAQGDILGDWTHPYECPELSLSGGATWDPGEAALGPGAQIGALALDGTVDGGLIRVNCIATDGGMVVVPANVMSTFEGTVSLSVTMRELAEVLIDAGTVLVDLREELSFNLDGGPACPLSP